MKCFLFLLMVGFSPLFVPAQDLTGIWRGSFVNSADLLRERYKYEIQFKQSPTHALKGVTYSYSYASKVFYGKAGLQGIFMDKTGNLIFREDKMIEYRISDSSQPCLMTCYLQYHKEGNLEYLEGTYSSVVMNSGMDCGSGKVYLEKVPTSDFKKEDFLTQKETAPKGARIKPGAADNLVAVPPARQPQTKPAAPPAAKVPVTKPKSPAGKTTTPPAKTTDKLAAAPKKQPQTNQPAGSNKATQKPSASDITQTPKRDTSRPKPDASIAPSAPPVNQVTPPTASIPEKKQIPAPKIFSERENKLVKTIVTNSPDIKIKLYDNGEIDDDTITVYHNNEVVVYKKRLSNEPIEINLGLESGVNTHEFVMVADNLGRIPPNTALMVITTGGKRYELFISSNEQRNAKVVIEYKPQ